MTANNIIDSTVSGFSWNDLNLALATPFQMATLAWAQASTISAVKNSCKKANDSQVQNYLVQWDRYVEVMSDTPAQISLKAPIPALALHVEVDPSGWPNTVEGPDFVCAPNVLAPPKINPPFHEAFPAVGENMNDIPLLPSPCVINGATFERQTHTSPFGTSVYLHRIS